MAIVGSAIRASKEVFQRNINTRISIQLRGGGLNTQSGYLSSRLVRFVSAYSLNEASRLGGKTVTELILHPDPDGKPTDLMCVNMMCEKVGEPCVCKLAKFVSKLPNLKHLDIGGNKLKHLPDSVWELSELEHLNISGNELENIHGIDKLQKLVSLVADDNNIVEADLNENQQLTQFSMQRNKLADIPEFSWKTLMSKDLSIKLDGNPCVGGNHNIYENIDGTIDNYEEDLADDIDMEDWEEYYYDENDDEEGTVAKSV